MSGGGLTGYEHDLYRLCDWANAVEKDNPLLAEQMRDMANLLGRYDYYLAGDIGNDAISKAWETYRSKWIQMDTEKVRQVLFEKCMDLVDSTIKGYGQHPDWI